jgi:hypothetical protein
MLGFIWTGIQLAWAGVWAEIWHWGLGIGLIILLVAGSIFSQSIPLIGPWLAPIRKDMLWAAAVVAVLLVGEYIGAADEKARCVARQVVVEKIVDKTVDKTKTPAYKNQVDPYQSKDF